MKFWTFSRLSFVKLSKTILKNVLDPNKKSSASNDLSISLIFTKSLFTELNFLSFSTDLSDITLEALLSFSTPEGSYPVLVPRMFLSLSIKNSI
jgi:hypothetical protein